MKFKKIYIIGIILVIGLVAIFILVNKNPQLFQGKIKRNFSILESVRNDLQISYLDALSAFRENYYLEPLLNDGRFNVNDPMTKENAVYLAFQVKNPLFSTTFDQDDLKNCYRDTNGSFTENAICFTKIQNYFHENSETFEPDRALTRAQAVLLIGYIFNNTRSNEDYDNVGGTALPYVDISESDYGGITSFFLRMFLYKNLLPFAQNTNRFEPDTAVNNGEFIEMLFRAKLVFIYEQPKYNEKLLSTFLNNKNKKLCKTPATVKWPNKINEEKINFAVNDSFAEMHPDWQTQINRLMKTINESFKKIGKKFIINEYLTYPDGVTRGQFAGQHPEYFYNNNFPWRIKGGTVFACVAPSPENSLTTCPDGDSQLLEVISNDLIYSVVKYTTNTTLENDFDGLLHELGHHLGIVTAHPEWYDLMSFYTTETTTEETTFPWWQFCALQPYDRDFMCQDLQSIYEPNELAWSPYSSAVIKYNFGHKYDSTSLRDFKAEKIKITVRDGGRPVDRAAVNIYNYIERSDGFGNEFRLFETKTTDENGVVIIDAPFWSKYFAFYLIDIVKGDFRKQKIVSFIDMEAENVMKNQCIVQMGL